MSVLSRDPCFSISFHFADFKKYVEAFAKDEELFFQKFAQAYSKLMELGVPAFGKSAGVFDSVKGALGLKK